jgi:hypothetical protein
VVAVGAADMWGTVPPGNADSFEHLDLAASDCLLHSVSGNVALKQTELPSPESARGLHGYMTDE